MINRDESTIHRTRPQITFFIDPDLLTAVDNYVEEHQASGVDRSAVLDEALRLWWREQLRQALRAQYLAPRSEEEIAEVAAWSHSREAAGTDFIRRYDENEAR